MSAASANMYQGSALSSVNMSANIDGSTTYMFQGAAKPDFSTRSYLDSLNMKVGQDNLDAFKSASISTQM